MTSFKSFYFLHSEFNGSPVMERQTIWNHVRTSYFDLGVPCATREANARTRSTSVELVELRGHIHVDTIHLIIRSWLAGRLTKAPSALRHPCGFHHGRLLAWLFSHLIVH
mmetsp:Transcript_18594/g.31112  ORF Transcript_18594/g.31112 Transcript_18594/m.31112 type:complete len:110 (-) Transcript_18594:904-1233(-)